MGKGKSSSRKSPPRSNGKGNNVLYNVQKVDGMTGGHFQRRLDLFEVPDPLYYLDEELRCQVERPYPIGLTDKEIEILRRVRRNAHNLEYGVGKGRFQIGRSTVLGLFPVFGPLIDVFLGVTLVNRPAYKIEGLPKHVKSAMAGRQFLNGLVNIAIPEAGDVYNAIYRVNSRNVQRLTEYLEVVGNDRMAKWGEGSKEYDKHMNKWNAAHQEALRQAKKKRDDHGCGCCCI